MAEGELLVSDGDIVARGAPIPAERIRFEIFIGESEIRFVGVLVVGPDFQLELLIIILRGIGVEPKLSEIILEIESGIATAVDPFKNVAC